MSRNTILACVELAANESVFGKRTTDFFADLANGAVGVELFSYCAGGGDDGWVLSEEVSKLL